MEKMIEILTDIRDRLDRQEKRADERFEHQEKRNDERFERLEHELRNVRQTVVSLEETTAGGFARVDEQLAAVNQRVDRTNFALADLTGHVAETNLQLAETNRRVEAGFAAVDRRFQGVDQRFEQVNSRLDNVIDIVGKHHGDLEARVTRIEAHLGL